MSSRARKNIRRVNHAIEQRQRKENIQFDDALQLFIQLKYKLVTAEELGEVEPARISALNDLYQDEYGRECPWFRNCEPLENVDKFSAIIDVSTERPSDIPLVRDDSFEQFVEKEDCAVTPAIHDTVVADEGIEITPYCILDTRSPVTFYPTIDFGIDPTEFISIVTVDCRSGSDTGKPLSNLIPIDIRPVLGLHLVGASSLVEVVYPSESDKLQQYYEFTPDGKLTIGDILYDCDLTQLSKALVSAHKARHASTMRHQTRTKLARTLVGMMSIKPTWTRLEVGQLITCMANAAEHRGRLIPGTTTLRIAAAWLFHVIKEFKLNRLGRYMPEGDEFDAYRVTPHHRSRTGRLKKSRPR